jgi:hypothetical protein
LVVGGVRRGSVVVGADGAVVVVVTVSGGAAVDVVVVACSVVVVVVVSSVDSEGVHADATSAIARTIRAYVVRVTTGALSGTTMQRLLDRALVPAR